MLKPLIEKVPGATLVDYLQRRVEEGYIIRAVGLWAEESDVVS